MMYNEKTRTSKYYSVGFIPTLNKYLLVETVSWVAWYNRYYEITQDEYTLAVTDVKQLDAIAEECMTAKMQSKRYLCSGRKCENNEQQLQMHQLILQASLPYSKDKVSEI